MEAQGAPGRDEKTLTFNTQNRVAQGALAGFLPYDVARRQLSGASGKPLIAYFHLRGSKPSEAQAELLRQDPQLPTVAESALLAWIDVRENPQLAQQLGVMRAPTWVLYNTNGLEQGRASKALTVADLRAGIDAARKRQ